MNVEHVNAEVVCRQIEAVEDLYKPPRGHLSQLRCYTAKAYVIKSTIPLLLIL